MCKMCETDGSSIVTSVKLRVDFYFSQVNPMASLRELHIKSLKVRSLAMANFLLDSFPSLEKTSSWTLNMNVEDTKAFRARVKEYRERGVKIEYKEW